MAKRALTNAMDEIIYRVMEKYERHRIDIDMLKAHMAVLHIDTGMQ